MYKKSRLFQHLALVLTFLLSSYVPAATKPVAAMPAVNIPGASKVDLRPAVTEVGGIIDTDTTWTLAGSPYEATTIVTVVSSVTLTVEPGVEVRFRPNTRLAVNGTLHAEGSLGNEILFTGTTQNPGDWQGVWIYAASGIRSLDNRLSYVTIEYGGEGIANSANLYVAGADIVIRHSTFRNGSNNGLTVYSDAHAEVSDTQFNGNANLAAHFFQIVDDPLLKRLSASGNGADAVGIGGVSNILVGAHTWEQMGLPYVAYGIIYVDQRGEVYIDPGVEIRFDAGARLDVAGSLTAFGTPDLPILFTGVNKTPGYWNGLNFMGPYQTYAVGEFRHVTIEYAGGGANEANIYVTTGRVTLNQSVVRNSLKDGIRLAVDSSRSSISSSQIYGNQGYGMRNTDTSYPVVSVASNNWWGDASGPRTDTLCNPDAAGDRVSANVVFQPFLADETQNPGAVPASGAYTISLTPHRWYAPANGTKVFVDVTVYDGEGRPAPARKVNLYTTRGVVEIGPLTGPDGRVFATVSSNSAGEAELTAALGDLGGCSAALSQTAKITFEAVGDPSGDFTEALAPYMNQSLKIDPLPITVGVPTSLIADITNPFDYDIYVDAVFGYAQVGLGLVFGPAGEVADFYIPAGQTRTMIVEWTPQVAGHVCIKLDYTVYKHVEDKSSAGKWKEVPVAKGSAQRNADPSPPSSKPSNADNAWDQGKYWDAFVGDMSDLWNAITDFKSMVSNFITNQMVGNLLKFINEVGGGIICGSGGGDQCGGYTGPELQLPGGSVGNMKADPPRQDYTILAVPETFTYPLQEPGPNMPAARADAINNLLAASFDLMTKQWVTVLTYDRLSGATNAKDITWASVQANAYIFYLNQTANAMIAYEKAIEDLIAELKSEGYEDFVRTPEEWQAYQDRLSTEGWSEVEQQAAAMAGVTPEGLELIRQGSLAADPAWMHGSVYDLLQNRADFYGNMGRMLQYTPPLGPIKRPGMINAYSPETSGETYPLARIEPMERTIQVGNPLTTTATVELKVRPLGLPADWLVSLSETSLELAPGQSVSVTVTIRPGMPVAQGTQPGIAVEGFINGQLIGGVAIDVIVPSYVDFTNPFPVYLPMLSK